MSNVVPLHRAAGDGSPSLIEAPHVGHHLVQFYEGEPFLFATVGRFLGAGLEAGEPVVVIATPEHTEGFLQHLPRAAAERAIANGSLALLDARETLGRFMVNGAPDRASFLRVLDEVLRRVAKNRPGVRVRAYGEMVDVLWREDQHAAAVALEQFWNEVCAARGISLLCAYVMANFYRVGAGLGLADVCAAHSHVLPTEAAQAAIHASAADELATLRERVRSLEAENKQLGTIGTTLRRVTADNRREGDARFELLVESVKDYAIFMLDPSGVVTTWNSGAERIKGYKASEIVGKHFSTFYPPEDVASGKCERELAGAIAEGRFEDEGWRIRQDGTRFWANVIITPLREPTGNVIGFAKVTRDLTERKHAENERVRLARIEEAARRKDEFLSIMGHELRNPLAPLVTAAHMIRLRGGRATDREMGILDRQLRQMTRIVSDLLDASRAMHDKIDLRPEVLEIGEVLAGAVDLAAPLVETRRHELVIEVPDRGLAVDVDADRMAQVFGNILNNAAKYTPDGGRIKVRAKRQGSDVEVTIEDNGQGIAPEMLTRIFDLFSQGDQGLERLGGGLGIGLAVARSLVQAHKGEIVAESDGLGRGSRFTVRLPYLATRSRPAPAVRERATASAGRRILIADDNRDSAELMQAVLENRGHEVCVAFDGPSALVTCQTFRPETVFLDIGLPCMDGYEVAKRMRSLAVCAGIQIIAVSGYARDQDRARALASGFTDHLAKPVDIDRLHRLLDATRR
jgi:PAS domain S-box-containing protein